MAFDKNLFAPVETAPNTYFLARCYSLTKFLSNPFLSGSAETGSFQMNRSIPELGFWSLLGESLRTPTFYI